MCSFHPHSRCYGNTRIHGILQSARWALSLRCRHGNPLITPASGHSARIPGGQLCAWWRPLYVSVCTGHRLVPGDASWAPAGGPFTNGSSDKFVKMCNGSGVI